MLQQAAAARPQPGEPPCGRDRVLRPRPGHHRKLEQAAHRGDPPVHRGRRCPAPGAEPDHRLARRAYRALLPVQVVEQASWIATTGPPGPFSWKFTASALHDLMDRISRPEQQDDPQNESLPETA